ncbi:PASTA domain-containing protein [Actinacidiphila acididurans]|uniref:PASTA domain-containing protein n=1 Tax=Actinacidiphila acididurans TaxID=2784346 RepID=A0ABS2TPY0_9ACTN|nr:PASTA domain-containing protein [Actinacidiphila acididurans]MBM9505394.1 PASTA domain-containing protein [Actinacidiphila acididurans]
MHTRTSLAAVGLIAAGALLTACNPNSTTGAKDTPASATAASKAVPKLTGMGLQTAQDAAQAAGFRDLTSHDSSGRGRHQILDRDWKVCSQTPAAGKAAPADSRIDLGAVKVSETCPAHDVRPPASAGAAMPNLVGQSLNAARRALGPDASITEKDATGSRTILLDTNWRICTQSPAAGAALHGQPVTFSAVKYGEACP